MTKNIKGTFSAFVITALFAGFHSSAQVSAKKVIAKKQQIAETDLKRWSDLDLEKDSVAGMSVDRAYAELLKGRKSKTVVVGVIDSGVDIDHEDLKGKIWTNTKEIPGNGIDDDKNGYIDDIHGWNFLGDAIAETLELTRMVKKNRSGFTRLCRDESRLRQTIQGGTKKPEVK